MLKEAGATEVHVAIGSPALAYPCFYGIDIQTRKELIAANHTVEETREIIGADSLTYLSIDGLIDSIGIDTDAPNGGLCVAYFDGKYPTPLYDYEERYVESLKEHTSLDEMSCSNNEKVRNVCTSRIIDVLIDMCNNSKMYEELDFDNDIGSILIP